MPVTLPELAIVHVVFAKHETIIGLPTLGRQGLLIGIEAVSCFQQPQIGHDENHLIGRNDVVPAKFAGRKQNEQQENDAQLLQYRKFMSAIADNLAQINSELTPGTRLVVVSKYRDVEEIRAAFNAGQRLFAENRVQALLERREQLPEEIEWHLIGHLQRNKVKYIAPFISMIHAVDSEELLREIDRQAQKNNRVIPCLLQVHVAMEETKFGFSTAELTAFYAAFRPEEYPGIRLAGLMAMASNTPDEAQVDREFAQVQALFQTLKTEVFAGNAGFCELSIGMSSDYRIAMRHGSTMVRIGTRVFAG